jgi:hypothetical protein
MKEIELCKRCLICNELLKNGRTYVCDIGDGDECIKLLSTSVFTIPQHIPYVQKQQFIARVILKYKERILNDNSIHR